MKPKISPQQVTVIGIGNGGHALAFHLAHLGHEVLCYTDPKFVRAVSGIKAKGGIESTDSVDAQGKKVTSVLKGFVNLSGVTTDIKKAMDFSDFVFIVLPSFAQVPLFELLIPHLRDEHIIMLMPGNFGTLLLKNRLEEQHIKTQAAIVEANSIIHAARRLEGGQVLITGVKRALGIGVLPASKTEETTERLQPVLPLNLQPAETVLEIALSNMNMVVHPGTLLLNMGWSETRQEGFKFYSEGISKSVGKVLDKIDAERHAVGEALKLNYNPTFINVSREFYKIDCQGTHDFSKKSEVHRNIGAPSGADSRYLTEDVPDLLVPIYQLGQLAGVDCPAMKSLICLASIMNDTDYMYTGRTLVRMGFEGLTPEQILERVKWG
jgi:opine dehydrogenase